MNQKIVVLITTIILVVLIIVGSTFLLKNDTNPEQSAELNTTYNQEVAEENVETTHMEVKLEETAGLTIVPTMSDEIKKDSSWCGTFQLVWNDMKNEVVKQEIVFTPQEKMVENLNKEEFKAEMLSEEYYYKKYGLKSLELKSEIEKGIKDKFDQTSDILDSFDWSEKGLNDPSNPNINRYFFYAMLYREFEFLKEFNKLENGQFGESYSNIEYFGIDEETDNAVGNQIDVLYYNSEDDFALSIRTKTEDEVIFCKKPEGKTFNEIYSKMNQKAESYTGSKKFENIDEFKAPKLEFNEMKKYEELKNKFFKTADGRDAMIAEAIQTIQFELDEKGGKIKSEAAIDMVTLSAAVEEREEKTPRYFYVDDTFAIFLREAGKTLPYFAARVDDITKFQ